MAARVTAKAGACLVMLVMTLGCLAVEQVSPPPTPPPPPPPPGFILPPDGSSERSSISAALHLHGLSNHGASTEPASILWHKIGRASCRERVHIAGGAACVI